MILTPVIVPDVTDALLQRDEVDAVSLDATHSFIAGKCGLVPVVTEFYGKAPFYILFLLRSVLKIQINIIKPSLLFIFNK